MILLVVKRKMDSLQRKSTKPLLMGHIGVMSPFQFSI